MAVTARREPGTRSAEGPRRRGGAGASEGPRRRSIPAAAEADADRFVRAESPAGPLFVAFGPHGICHVALAEELDGDDSRFAALHERRFGRSAVPAASALPGLAEALRSGRGDRLRYDLRGVSGFQAVVLAATLRIPPGEVRTYGELAAELGKPRAARAVGQALARNPVPVLVPCHRVVAADGGLGGYGLGLEAKRRLLAAEGHTKPSRIE